MSRGLFWLEICWVLTLLIVIPSNAQDLYLATKTAVKKISNINSGVSQQDIHVGSPQDNIIGLAIDLRDNLLFWTDLSSLSQNVGIWKSSITGESKTPIVEGNGVGIGQPTGLAVDWVNKLLYWTDAEKRTVEICDYNGGRRRTIVTRGLSTPRGIVSDPINGHIYIGDQDYHQILRCSPDGIDCQVWKSSDSSECSVYWPNQLTINYRTQRLYWADGWASTVCSCQFDGTSCTTHNVTDIQGANIFGVSVTGSGTIYFSTLNNRTVSVLNPNTGPSEILNDANGRSYFMVSSDQGVTQPSGTPLCASMSCSDVCIPHSTSVAYCACPSYSGKVMVDATRCQALDEFLLYADTGAGEVGMITSTTTNLMHPTTLIARAEHPVAVIFDSLNDDVYFSDIGVSTIEKVSLTGANRMEILNSSYGIDQVEGLALDTKQRRLYFSNHGYMQKDGVAFWHKIEMFDLQMKKRRTVVTGVTKPRGLWVDSTARYLYYTDWGTTPVVGRVTLDGLQQGDILRNNVVRRPNGVIKVNNQLFVVDSEGGAGVNRFHNSTLNGQTSSPISFGQGQSLVFPFGVAGISQQLYFSDADASNSKLVTYNLATAVTATYSYRFEKLTGIHYTKKSVSARPDNGICSPDTSPCLDGSVCFTREDPLAATCLCPSDRFNYLAEDRKNCLVPQKYILFADIDGIKMAPRETSDDPHIYTLIHGTSTCGNFQGIAFDERNKQIYFSSSDSGMVYRASIDGTNIRPIMERDERIVNIAYSSGRLYWTCLYGCNGTVGGVYSWDFVSNPVQIKENVSEPHAIAADGRLVYWSEDRTNIHMYDIIDKTKQIIDIRSNIDVTAMALDKNGHLYISSSNGQLLLRKFPTKSYKSELENVEGNFTTSNGVFVAGKYVYMANVDNGIKRLDRLTKLSQTTVKSGTLSRPGQIVAISPDDTQQQLDEQKEGTCPQSTSSSCTTLACSGDETCPGQQKCCNGIGCSTCENPVVDQSTTCTLLVDGMSVLWNRNDGKFQSGCKECDCNNRICAGLSCPSLSCPTVDQVMEGCCRVCPVIKKCSDKPTIPNCQSVLSRQVTLLPGESSIDLDIDLLSLRNVTAMSCDKQPVTLSPLTPSRLSWLLQPQIVQMKAEDQHGMTPCKIAVTVKDKEGPVFDYCPKESIEVFTRSEAGVKVEWQEPFAEDNTGQITLSLTEDSKKNGDTFPPGVNKIVYVATDGAGNQARCEFSVNVTKEEFICKDPPIIMNGYLKCISSPVSTECKIDRCHEGYEIFPDNDHTYICSGNDMWTPAFPDLFDVKSCFKPEPLEITLPFFVALVDCPYTEFDVHDLLNCLSAANICPASDSGISICSKERITMDVTGGRVTITGRTMGKLEFGEDAGLMISKIATVNDRLINFFTSGDYKTQCSKIACRLDTQGTRSEDKSKAEQKCGFGSQEHTIRGKRTCASCSAGTYYSSADVTCHKCRAGTFQNRTAQPVCLSCPSGTISEPASFLASQCIPGEEKLPSTEGPPTGAITGGVVGMLVLIIIIIVLAVFFLRNRRRNQKGHEYEKKGVIDKRQSEYYDDFNEHYNEIPADLPPPELPNRSGLAAVDSDGYCAAKDVDDGYCAAKDVDDGYCVSKDVAGSFEQDGKQSNPYVKLSNVSEKSGDVATYDKLQNVPEKAETFSNPAFSNDI